MSDEAVAEVTETAAEPAAPAEPQAYEPGKRSFSAFLAESAAKSAASEETPAEEAEKPAAEAKKPAAEAKKPAAKPATEGKPPPNRFGGARKAFFEAKNAQEQAQKATEQAQTTGERLSQLEKDVANARSNMDQARELFEKGDPDGALKLIGARGVDNFESLQKRVLAQLKDAPVDDPRTEELRREVEALKAERAEEKRARAEAEQRTIEGQQEAFLLNAVKETTANSEDSEVKRLSGVPGFNEHVLNYAKMYRNEPEERILEVARDEFLGIEQRILASRGFTEEQIQAIMKGTIPGDVKTEASKAAPARRSANVETAKAVEPRQHKPSVTISTNAAESTHTQRKWDPKSRERDWNNAKRTYVPPAR
jgi:hypothetical protein